VIEATGSETRRSCGSGRSTRGRIAMGPR
jgi:hypothetical protein